MWTVALPLRVPLNKKETRFFAINLNEYRNTHYQSLNIAKVKFAELVAPSLKHLPGMEKCTLEYVLYPGTKRLCDVSNICSVADKFFCDTLVTQGYLREDDYTVISDIKYKFGEVDRTNPRVEVIISPIGETHPIPDEEEEMQIILVQAEVEQAIHDYMSKRLTLSDGTTFNIDLSATRGPEGIKATIDLVPASDDKEPVQAEVKPAPAKVKPASARAKAVEKAPEPASEPVEEESIADTTEQEETPTSEPEAEDTAQEPKQEATPPSTKEKPKSLFANLKKPQNS